jgi:hypothetical protein
MIPTLGVGDRLDGVGGPRPCTDTGRRISEYRIEVLLELVGLVAELDNSLETDIVDPSILNPTGNADSPQVKEDLAIWPSRFDDASALGEPIDSKVVSSFVVLRQYRQGHICREIVGVLDIISARPDRKVSKITLMVRCEGHYGH